MGATCQAREVVTEALYPESAWFSNMFANPSTSGLVRFCQCLPGPSECGLFQACVSGGGGSGTICCGYMLGSEGTRVDLWLGWLTGVLSTVLAKGFQSARLDSIH